MSNNSNTTNKATSSSGGGAGGSNINIRQSDAATGAFIPMPMANSRPMSVGGQPQQQQLPQQQQQLPQQPTAAATAAWMQQAAASMNVNIANMSAHQQQATIAALQQQMMFAANANHPNANAAPSSSPNAPSMNLAPKQQQQLQHPQKQKSQIFHQQQLNAQHPNPQMMAMAATGGGAAGVSQHQQQQMHQFHQLQQQQQQAYAANMQAQNPGVANPQRQQAQLQQKQQQQAQSQQQQQQQQWNNQMMQQQQQQQLQGQVMVPQLQLQQISQQQQQLQQIALLPQSQQIQKLTPQELIFANNVAITQAVNLVRSQGGKVSKNVAARIHQLQTQYPRMSLRRVLTQQQMIRHGFQKHQLKLFLTDNDPLPMQLEAQQKLEKQHRLEDEILERQIQEAEEDERRSRQEQQLQQLPQPSQQQQQQFQQQQQQQQQIQQQNPQQLPQQNLQQLPQQNLQQLPQQNLQQLQQQQLRQQQQLQQQQLRQQQQLPQQSPQQLPQKNPQQLQQQSPQQLPQQNAQELRQQNPPQPQFNNLQQQQQVLQQLKEQRRRFLHMQQGQQHLQQGQGQIIQNPQQLLQQQQLSVQAPPTMRASYQLDDGGAGTPRSPTNRPPSVHPRPPSTMLQSASPTRPPSEQPSLRQSFILNFSTGELQAVPQSLPPDSRGAFPFYKPLKSSKGGGSSRDGEPTDSTAAYQGVAQRPILDPFNSNAQPQMPVATEVAVTGASSVPQSNSANNSSMILNQYLPSATPTLANNAINMPLNSESHPSLSQKSNSTSAPTPSSSGKTPTHRQPHHESTLSWEEVKTLANQLSCEEKIIWVSKQILGTHGSNGFQKAMSNIQKAKRQRARQYKKHHQDDLDIDGADEESLKAKTFNVRLAEKMIMEMNQGLQFCNLMADTIKSVLRELDPENPLIYVNAAPAIPSSLDVKNASSLSETKDASLSATSARFQEPSQEGDGGEGGVPLLSTDVLTSIMKGSTTTIPQLANVIFGGQHAETVAKSNTQGSTLRKLRKRSSIKAHADRDLVALIGDQDDNGKKLHKKELSNRLFEATRFRTLKAGDYVAAKVSSQDIWILARVLKQWDAVKVPLRQMLEMPVAKRDALFRDRVFIQDNEDYNGDLSSARAVERQYIIPLARSHVEGNEWGKRLRKGSRVYAIYPQTTTFYCATVIDCTTYCQNQDDVIVVEFDGDENDNGVIPQRHILARFVTLAPREFETNRKKRKFTSDAAARRRSSKVNETTHAALPTGHPADDMLVESMNDSSSIYKNVKYDDIIVTGLTPGPTPGATPRATPGSTPPL